LTIEVSLLRGIVARAGVTTLLVFEFSLSLGAFTIPPEVVFLEVV
jgi:hypothetical protein